MDIVCGCVGMLESGILLLYPQLMGFFVHLGWADTKLILDKLLSILMLVCPTCHLREIGRHIFTCPSMPPILFWRATSFLCPSNGRE